MVSSKPGLIFGFLALLLIIVGFVVLASASAPFAYQKFGSVYYFLKHQILYGFLPGIFLFLLFWKINYLKWQRLSKLIFVLCVAALGLVFVPGIGTSFERARSWIIIGPISFQPSEFVKLGLIIFLAGLLSRFKEGEIKHIKKGFLKYFLFTFLICGLLILQPDFGGACLIGLIAVTLFFLGGGRILHLGILGIVGGIASVILIFVAPYRMARLIAFLKPSFDPQGIGYHINQALIAIGSGGFWGLGLGHSKQRFQYLPEVIGDSIFAIMGEELGFLLSVAFVVVFFVFLWQGFKIAEKSYLKAPELSKSNGGNGKFGYYLASGIVIWFGWQMFLNIGSMIGILPLTGLTLPFISYGGSSLAALMAAVGLMMNIDKNSS
jgi:cell division protein FtsW